MKKTDPANLLAYGLHLGHKKQKVNPKAKSYIYKIDKGISIIDLFQTAKLLDEAKTYMAQLAKDDKKVLFVATKKVAREIVTDLCKEHNLYHMTNKWVGGLLTNFQEISKNVKKMNEMKEEQMSGEWEKIPKHEKTANEKKLNRISTIYSGIKDMKKLPDALFILDIRKEKNALNEADQTNIPVIGVVDTNVDPDLVSYPIPANDDAVLSVKYISEEIIGAYTGGGVKAENSISIIAEKAEKVPTKKAQIDKTPSKEKPAKKKPAKKKAIKKNVS